MVAGLVVGCAPWTIEAAVRHAGFFAGLHTASDVQGGMGWHPDALLMQLHALNGPLLCRPCHIPWKHAELSLWWLALPVLVVAGLGAARRSGRLLTHLLPVLCAGALACPYLFLLDYSAPRFLLPSYALLALPVAEGPTRPRPPCAGPGAPWPQRP
ncbi:hypothetical protein ACFQ2B_30165 [Streptomyces stramineus]